MNKINSKPTISCWSNLIEKWENLHSLGLFDETRANEIAAYIADDKFGPVILANGKKVPGWIAHLDSGQMYTEDFLRGSRHYVNQRVLEGYLTTEEIERINKYANNLWREREDQRKFENAKKVSAADWTGPVLNGDTYYESVDDFKGQFYSYDLTDEDEAAIEDGEDAEEIHKKYWPDYLWGVDIVEPVLKLDIHSILEDATQDAYEDFSCADLDGVKEFEEAIDKFVKLNERFVNWRASEKVAVLLK
jgi:hypothetical protein